MGCSFKLVWRCHDPLSGFIVKGRLPQVSRQSRLSANSMGDNEMIPGAAYRPPDIFLMTEKNPRKPQLEDRR